MQWCSFVAFELSGYKVPMCNQTKVINLSSSPYRGGGLCVFQHFIWKIGKACSIWWCGRTVVYQLLDDVLALFQWLSWLSLWLVPLLQYIEPGDAHKLEQAELVVIDEAAAIPLPLVKKLLVPCLVFMASTVNGWDPLILPWLYNGTI